MNATLSLSVAASAAVIPPLSALAGHRPVVRMGLLAPITAAVVWFDGSPALTTAVFAAAAGLMSVTNARAMAGFLLTAAGVGLFGSSGGGGLTPELLAPSVVAVGCVIACGASDVASALALCWASLVTLAMLCVKAANPALLDLPTAVLADLDGQFGYRANVLLTAAATIGFCVWPFGGIWIGECRKKGPASGFVPLFLALATTEAARTLTLSGVVSWPGLSTAAMAAMLPAALLCLAAGDLRAKAVSAFGFCGCLAAALLPFRPALSGSMIASASLAAALGLAVINRLEARYGTRETAAFRGIARRHPSASFLFAGAIAGLVATYAGPMAVQSAHPLWAAISGWALAWTLACGWLTTAALASALTGILFGTTRLPEFRGPAFERVGIRPRIEGPLVGASTMIVWASCLLAVAVATTGRPLKKTVSVPRSGPGSPQAASEEAGRSRTNSAPEPPSARSRTETDPFSRRASVETM